MLGITHTVLIASSTHIEHTILTTLLIILTDIAGMDTAADFMAVDIIGLTITIIIVRQRMAFIMQAMRPIIMSYQVLAVLMGLEALPLLLQTGQEVL